MRTFNDVIMDTLIDLLTGKVMLEMNNESQDYIDTDIIQVLFDMEGNIIALVDEHGIVYNWRMITRVAPR